MPESLPAPELPPSVRTEIGRRIRKNAAEWNDSTYTDSKGADVVLEQHVQSERLRAFGDLIANGQEGDLRDARYPEMIVLATACLGVGDDAFSKAMGSWIADVFGIVRDDLGPAGLKRAFKKEHG
ncbi:MAG: hypothetical protein M3T56_08525 [Chloroflexota bacterium]|nr:hypothetical protein [Chloroflexota bacterium]